MTQGILTAKWWKVLCALLLIYTAIAGFLVPVPTKPILHETIRNLYFHVCMWFAMMFIFTVSLVYSIKYLMDPKKEFDIIASQTANTGTVFGILGLITGMLWLRYTWGETGKDWWAPDPKLNGALIALLSYFAYIVLRISMDDEQKKARVAAVYNIFAYVMMIVFVMIYPRLSNVDSLHPGNGGNPGFNQYDLDNHMRMVFYPAVMGWVLLSAWIASINIRMEKINSYHHNKI
jgi:heme exporter protein C